MEEAITIKSNINMETTTKEIHFLLMDLRQLEARLLHLVAVITNFHTESETMQTTMKELNMLQEKKDKERIPWWIITKKSNMHADHQVR